jgi:hypothetical protein
MKNTKQWIALAALLLAGCSGASTDGSNAVSQTSAIGSSQVIWFGQNEVLEGHLKSSDGALPQAGGTVTLELFLDQLSSFMCKDYCAATVPHVFVRFDSTSSYTELQNVPKGYLDSAGGVTWDAVNNWLYHYDASLSIPPGSDRVEAYIYWDRVSYSCVLESEETCTINGPIDGAYLSNYGRNFSISVAP